MRKDDMERDIAIAKQLGLEVVGKDDDFGVWVLEGGFCYPLIDNPKYKETHGNKNAR